MVSMQAFYNVLFSEKKHPLFAGLLRIARAKLEDILAVRSELAWDIWNEAK